MKYLLLHKCLKLFYSFIFLLLMFNGIKAQTDKVIINMALTDNMYSNVNVRDAKATIELWAQMVTESSTRVLKTKSSIYKNDKILLKNINKGKVDLIFLTSVQFLNFNNSSKAVPYFSTTRNKRKFLDLYLITKKNEKILSFSDLKNKRISVQGGRYRLLTELWLDVLCLKNGIKDKYKFFKEIEFIEKPSKVILNTFFGKSDVCLSTDFIIDIVSEMNPQISKMLEIQFQRKNLINDVFCINELVSEELKKNILLFGKDIDKKPRTEQIYKLFKIDGTYKLEENDLSETIKLWNEYNALK